MFSKAQQIADNTSIVAEAIAMKEGCEYYIENQLVALILETDSLALKIMVNRGWENPWSIYTIIRKIKEMRSDGNIQITHKFKEGNTLADF